MIRSEQIQPIIIGLCMALVALLAWQLRPKAIPVSSRPTIDLERMVPEGFGDWMIDRTVMPVPPSPEVASMLEETYAQTLERTYINGQGQRIMVSIAYSNNQRDALRAHFPEGCYAGQGFEILSEEKTTIDLNGRKLPVSRMVAQKGLRHEPVTYWLTVGGVTAVSTGFQRKIARIAQRVTGEVPDGLLVRISNIDKDDVASFELQRQFLLALLPALDDAGRRRLFGVER